MSRTTTADALVRRPLGEMHWLGFPSGVTIHRYQPSAPTAWVLLLFLQDVSWVVLVDAGRNVLGALCDSERANSMFLQSKRLTHHPQRSDRGQTDIPHTYDHVDGRVQSRDTYPRMRWNTAAMLSRMPHIDISASSSPLDMHLKPWPEL
ncbi:hypothetical protein AC579_4007 [Pseudocercospora musae]|uniref:Uncharacterized protein n=1 Tax=Pseudocercospora musae TaxID=113226 RepID=A0A139IHU7_9PEZI|nr:hypothetical protein AC579_4007 [Pseudocercospora musae]